MPSERTPRTCSTTRHPTETKEQEMRSPQNTATPLARSGFVRGRLVGAAAIALAASLVIENLVVLAGSPTYAAPLKEVLAFHADHRVAVAIAVGLEALNVPLLLLFVTGLHGLVG